MNSLQIKNWLSIIKSSLDEENRFLSKEEKKSFIEEMELFVLNIEEMSKKIKVIEETLEDFEKVISRPIKKSSKSKVAENDYIQTVLMKISILKNIINREVGSDNSMVSPDLMVVEYIENDIKTNKSISKDQLEQLNMIYNKQRIAGKI